MTSRDEGSGRTGLKRGASRRLARAQIRKVNLAGRDTGGIPAFSWGDGRFVVTGAETEGSRDRQDHPHRQARAVPK
jgi:hypothetical protein